MTGRPALVGGDPLFPDGLRMFRPTLPPYEEVAPDVAELFETGMLTAGPHAVEFERRLAEHLGVEHVVAVSSCTVGLVLACQALELTGEAIVPSFTFMATVHPLAWNGVQPVFVDIDPATWNVDPVQVEKAITKNTSGIVAVHLLGTPAAVEALEEIADRHGLKLLFDAAHGFGALHEGHPLGRHGDVEVFSATPTKVLSAVEGGIVATNDAEIARRVRVARNYGNPGDYGSEVPGLNARMPEFNALVGMKSLEMLERNVLRRQEIAATYKARIGALPGITFQRIDEGDRSSFKEFSLLVDEAGFGMDRATLARALAAEGIDSRFYYDPPVHRHDAYRDVVDAAAVDLPVTDAVARSTITIPIYSHMDDETVDRVCTAVERAHAHCGDVRARAEALPS
ncbi:MAG TPA: DegT/DnrJ/EryC1/StrS family aminotransferase [Actinomycetota bacterium]|nr:DegT/DnrJ/EryC1/StrS family aminotransferase [Actinomycetota bacterium]